MGALALAGALASGTELALMPENCNSEEDMIDALRRLAERMKQYTPPRRHATILVKHGLYREYNIEHIRGHAEEIFRPSEVRETDLGYTQRGGRTSYYDRMLGTLMGVKAVSSLIDDQSSEAGTAIMLQLRGGTIWRADLRSSLRGWSDETRMQRAKEMWMYEEFEAMFDELGVRPSAAQADTNADADEAPVVGKPGATSGK